MPAEHDHHDREMQRMADDIAMMRLDVNKVRADMEANRRLLARFRWPLISIKPETENDRQLGLTTNRVNQNTIQE